MYLMSFVSVEGVGERGGGEGGGRGGKGKRGGGEGGGEGSRVAMPSMIDKVTL